MARCVWCAFVFRLHPAEKVYGLAFPSKESLMHAVYEAVIYFGGGGGEQTG